MALSRVRTLDALQVFDFKRSLCIEPSQAVIDFLALHSLDTEDPSNCCRAVPYQEDFAADMAALVCA